MMTMLLPWVAIMLGSLPWGPLRAESDMPPPAAENGAVRFTVPAFRVAGDNPLSAEQTAAVLAPFTGEGRTLADLQAAAAALQAALMQAGQGLYQVTLPPQTVEGAVVLQLRLLRVGQVSVTGTQHHGADNVRAALPVLQAGASPTPEALTTALQMANENPSKYAMLTLKSGSAAELVDVEIKVRDVDPLLFYLSAANTGNEATGHDRVTAGVRHSNLWGRDHVLAASYTTSLDKPHGVQQGGVSYLWPLYPLRTTVSAYYVDSRTDSGRVADVFDVSGSGRFAGLRASYHLTVFSGWNHALSLSAEHKRYRNLVDYAGTDVGNRVTALPIGLDYELHKEFAWGKVALNLGWVSNVRHGAAGQDADYAQLRSGADAGWQAWRGGAALSRHWKTGFDCGLNVDGQWSRDALIPGEQFGAGGARSVRGYEEREVSGDQGLRASLECGYRPADGWRLAAFGDWARVQMHDHSNARQLSGVGLGASWSAQKQVQLRVDAAQALREGATTRRERIRLHAQLLASF